LERERELGVGKEIMEIGIVEDGRRWNS